MTVKIRNLEWQRHGYYYRASTGFGSNYWIRPSMAPSSMGKYFIRLSFGSIEGIYDDLEKAKAAAQKDFKERSRANIVAEKAD